MQAGGGAPSQPIAPHEVASDGRGSWVVMGLAQAVAGFRRLSSASKQSSESDEDGVETGHAL